jgi:hypothetical protein
MPLAACDILRGTSSTSSLCIEFRHMPSENVILPSQTWCIILKYLLLGVIHNRNDCNLSDVPDVSPHTSSFLYIIVTVDRQQDSTISTICRYRRYYGSSNPTIDMHTKFFIGTASISNAFHKT